MKWPRCTRTQTKTSTVLRQKPKHPKQHIFFVVFNIDMLQTVFLYVVYFIAIRTLVPRIRQLSITGFTGFTKKKLSAPTSSPPSPSRTAPSRTLFDFDGEHAEVFRVMSEQHLHERGPWMRMKQFTEEYAAEKEGLQILDIATGSGEPGE